MPIRTCAIGLAIVVAGPLSPAFAGTWDNEMELGTIITTGNTETQTVNAKAKLDWLQNKWGWQGTGDALYQSDETGTTAQRYLLGTQLNYNFAEKEYVFGAINYENDRFSGFDYRLSETVGYGRHIIPAPDMLLTLDLGAGARQSIREGGDSAREAILRGTAKYEWALSETSKFTQDLSIEAGADATITRAVTALRSLVAESLAMKLSLTVKYISEVPEEVQNTDSETAVTLVYSF